MPTLARQKHSQRERSIAKAIGLTDAQLDALLRIKAGYWPGNAAACLEAKGLAYRTRNERGYYAGARGLTEAGELALRRAGELGF